MDKTLEIVVAAAVILMVGAIAAFMVSTEAGSFTGFITGETDRAECQKYQGEDQQAFEANSCEEVLGVEYEGDDEVETEIVTNLIEDEQNPFSPSNRPE